MPTPLHYGWVEGTALPHLQLWDWLILTSGNRVGSVVLLQGGAGLLSWVLLLARGRAGSPTCLRCWWGSTKSLLLMFSGLAHLSPRQQGRLHYAAQVRCGACFPNSFSWKRVSSEGGSGEGEDIFFSFLHHNTDEGGSTSYWSLFLKRPQKAIQLIVLYG